MRFQLFEQYNDKIFTANIAKDKIPVYIYQAPTPYRHSDVELGTIYWELPINITDRGIEIAETAIISHMDFVLEIENEEGPDSFSKRIQVNKGTFKPQQFKTTFNYFPLTLKEVEINMRHSTEPEDWKIELTIGTKEKP